MEEMNLPKESHELKLERESLDALRPIFHKTDKFIISPHRSYDYGVDCNIELLNERGNSTNINFHAQLKAIDKLEKKAKNKDGSYSIQISTSNVNYLLNSPKSIYILYVKSQKQFFYCWADVFFLKLKKEDNDWFLKNSRPTLRFFQIIDQSALIQIHEEVREVGIMNRQLSEQLIQITSSTRPKSSKVIIDVSQLTVLGEVEIIEAIEKVGFTYINRGQSKDLVSIAYNLTKNIETSPLVCLILAFASFNVGLIHESLSYIRKAKANKVKLDGLDKAYLKFLEAKIKFSQGLISNESYEKIMGVVSEEESIKLYYELMETQKIFLQNPEEGIEKTKNLVQKLEKEHPQYPAIVLQAKIDLMRVEGWIFNHIYITNIERINAIEMGSGMINLLMREESVKTLLELNKKWTNFSRTLQEELLVHDNKIILAGYYQVYVSTYLKSHITRSILKVEKKIDGLVFQEEKDDKTFELLFEFINRSIEIYKEFEHNYNLCASLATLFDLLEFLGEEEKAKNALQELYEIGELYEFYDIIEKTKNLDSGGSYYKGLIKSIEVRSEKFAEFKKRESDALERLKRIDEKEREMKLIKSKKSYDDSMVIELFNLGFFEIPKIRINEFFDILNIEKKSELAKQLIFMSFEFEHKIIPRLNVSYEKIPSEGYGEGNFSIKNMEDLERVVTRREKLFNANFYRIDYN